MFQNEVARVQSRSGSVSRTMKNFKNPYAFENVTAFQR